MRHANIPPTLAWSVSNLEPKQTGELHSMLDTVIIQDARRAIMLPEQNIPVTAMQGLQHIVALLVTALRQAGLGCMSTNFTAGRVPRYLQGIHR